jgi:recombination protein RecR
VGSRTAERLAFHLLRAPEGEVVELAEAIEGLRGAVTACSVCHTLTEQDPCALCSDTSRDGERLLVVEQPQDVAAFEDAGWHGRYHVLLGHVNAMEGIEAGDLTLAHLVERVEAGGIAEVIIATNPDYEGDATALHVQRALTGMDVTVSRIARGIASGSAIEYSNAAMLSDSLAGRANMDDGS